VDALAGAVDEVIVVNDAWRLLPDAHHLYAADKKWWQLHIGDIIRDFEGRLHTQHKGWKEKVKGRDGVVVPAIDPQSWGIQEWHSEGGNSRPGLCTEGGKLHTGGNSGYQAINVAYHLGATRILLLGYDMSAWGGPAHFFGDHPKELNAHRSYEQYAGGFNTIDPASYGLEIINCTRRTRLVAFPRATLEDALCKT
jgi:hypothetical protein